MSTGGFNEQVVIQLSADATQLRTAINQAGRNFEDFTRRVSQSIDQLNQTMARRIDQANQQMISRQESMVRKLRYQIEKVEIQSIHDVTQRIEADTNRRIQLAQLEQRKRDDAIRNHARTFREQLDLMAANAEATERMITRIRVEGAERRRQHDEREANRQRENLRRGLIGVAATGTVAGGVVMADVKQNVDVAREFDKSMRNANALAKMSEDQLARVSRRVLDLTKEIYKTAPDLANTLRDAFGSGFENADQALEITRVAARGATAGLTDTEIAGRALMATMNAYNMKTGPEANYIMDILFKTVDKGVVTFPQLAQSFGNVVSMGAAAQVPLEEMGGAIALLTRYGLPASEAVTSLNSLLTHIIKPARDASRAGKDLGVAWFDVNNAAEHLAKGGLRQALEDIAKHTDGNVAKMGKLLPEIRALRGALKLAAEDGDAFNKIMRDFTPDKIYGSTQSALDEQMKSFDAKIEKFNRAIDRVRIALGSGILDILTPIGEAAGDLADKFDALPQPIKTLIGMLELITGSALIAAAVLATLGLGVMGLQVILGTTLAEAGAAIMAFVTGPLLALATSPAGLVIMGLVAAAALLYGAWRMNLGGLRDITESFMAWWMPTWQGVSDWFMSVWTDYVAPAISVAWEGIVNTFNFGTKLIDNILRTFTGFVGFIFSQIGKIMTGRGGEALKILLDNFKNGFKAIGDTVQSFASFITGMFGDIGSVIANLWKAFTDPSKSGEAQAGIDAALNRIRVRFLNMHEGLRADFKTIADQGGKMWSELITGPPSNLKPGQAGYKMPAPKPKDLSSFGGKDLWTSGEVEFRMRRIKQEVDAGNKSIKEHIKLLEEFMKKENLTGSAATQVQATINNLKKKAAREEEAEFRRAAAAHRKFLAEKKREETAFNKAIEEAAKQQYDKLKVYITNQYNEIIGQYKKTAAGGFLDDLVSTKEKIANLEKLSGLAVGGPLEGHRQKFKKQIDESKAHLNELMKQQEDAKAKSMDAIENAEERLEGDKWTRKLQKFKARQKQELDIAMKFLGESHELTKRLKAVQADELADFEADHIREANEVIEREQETSLARKLQKSDEYWDDYIEQEELKGDQLNAALKAKEDARLRITSEYNQERFDDLLSTVNKVSNIFDKLVDAESSATDKFGAVIGILGETFKKEIAGVIIPALDSLKVAVMSNPILLVIGAAIAGLMTMATLADNMAQKAEEQMQKAAESSAELLRIRSNMTKDRFAKIAAEEKATLLVKEPELKKAEKEMLKKQQEVQAAQMKKALPMQMGPDGRPMGGSWMPWDQWDLDAKIAAAKEAGDAVAKIQAEIDEAKYKRDEAEKQLNREIRAQDLEAFKQHYEAMGDLDAARSVQKQMDTETLLNKLQDLEDAHIISSQQREQMWRDGQILIERKFNEEMYQERKKANDRLLDLQDTMNDLTAVGNKRNLLAQYASGSITKEDFDSGKRDIDNQLDMSNLASQLSKISFAQSELNGRSLTPTERADAEKDLWADIVKSSKALYGEMEDAIDNYTKNVEDKYTKIDQKLNIEKRKLEDKKELEERAHQDKIRQLDLEEEALQHKLDALDREIEKIQLKYKLEREYFTETDKDASEFQKKVSEMALGKSDTESIEKLQQLKQQLQAAEDAGRAPEADRIRKEMTDITELTFEALDVQMENLRAQRALEMIDQETFGASMSTLSIKKAALAKKELDDDKISFRERTRVLKMSQEAYESWQEAQMSLIDYREHQEIRAQELQKKTHEDRIFDIQGEKLQTQIALTQIEQKYSSSIANINAKIQDNKTEWDKAMDDIKLGLDKKIPAIANAYQPLLDKLTAVVNKMKEMNTLSGGSSYQYQQSSGSQQYVGYDSSYGAVGGKYKTSYFASGGWAKGGIPGTDSIPAMLQDGEYVMDTSLSSMLFSFLQSWSQMAPMAYAMPMGGSKTFVTQVHIKEAVIDSEERVQLLTDRIGEKIARDMA